MARQSKRKAVPAPPAPPPTPEQRLQAAELELGSARRRLDLEIDELVLRLTHLAEDVTRERKMWAGSPQRLVVNIQNTALASVYNWHLHSLTNALADLLDSERRTEDIRRECQPQEPAE
jgi:hypothetical protein